MGRFVASYCGRKISTRCEKYVGFGHVARLNQPLSLQTGAVPVFVPMLRIFIGFQSFRRHKVRDLKNIVYI